MPRYWEIMFRVRPTVGYSPDSPHKYIMDQLYIDLIAHNYRAVSEEIKKRLNTMPVAMYMHACGLHLSEQSQVMSVDPCLFIVGQGASISPPDARFACAYAVRTPLFAGVVVQIFNNAG